MLLVLKKKCLNEHPTDGQENIHNFMLKKLCLSLPTNHSIHHSKLIFAALDSSLMLVCK